MAIGLRSTSKLASLREYLLVAQHRVRLDLYVRGDAGRWILTSIDDPTDSVYLPSVDCTLKVAEVYDKATSTETRSS